MPKNSLEHIQFECHCTQFSLGPNVANHVKKQREFYPCMLKKIINTFHTLPYQGGVKKSMENSILFFILFLKPSLRVRYKIEMREI